MARRLLASARTSLLAIVAAAALAFAGCGGDESSPATTAADTVTQATPPPPAPAPAPSPAPAPAKPKPTAIVIVVDQGRPRGGIKRPKIEQGEKVVLVIRSDAGEAVHVHGYDIERPLRPGTPLRIPITASLPGRFEVELHHPDVVLAVLEVRP